MKDTIKDLLKSKKALVAILAALAWVAGRFGLHLDQSELLGAVGPLWAYVLGQGIADAGKSAAQIKAGE